MLTNNSNIYYYYDYEYNDMLYSNNYLSKIFIIWLIFILIGNTEEITISYILIFFSLFLYQPY